LENPINEVGKVVPELYYDLTARIVPAAIALFLYFPPWQCNSFLFKLDFVWVLLVAYLVGISVDCAVNLVEDTLIDSKILRLKSTGSCLCRISERPPSEQDLIKKLLAESVMFRSCMALCLPCIVLCLPIFYHQAPILGFGDKRYLVYSIALFIVFFMSHVDRRKALGNLPPIKALIQEA
jgi:hypothetical protein